MSPTDSPISLSLPEPARKYLDDQIAAGRSASAGQYILHLIEEDQQLEREEQELRALLEVGLRELDEGNVESYDSAEELLSDIKRRGRERLAGGH